MTNLIRKEMQRLLELMDKKWCQNHQEINDMDSETGNTPGSLLEDILQSGSVRPVIIQFVG